MVRQDQQSCDERSMNHKIFSFFSVATVSKSRQYRHWKSCLLPATVSKASPLEGSLSPQAFVKSFEVTESLGRKRSDRKPLRSQCHYFLSTLMLYFFVYFIDVWTNGSFEWRTKTHLETFTIYRHIIVSMKLGVRRVWENTKWFQKNMSCFYFDKHDLATLIFDIL